MLPSSNRTCRFPASGSRSNCRHRPWQGGRLTDTPAAIAEGAIVSHAFRRPEGPLTAAPEVLPQTLSHVRVDPPERHPRISKAEVVGPALQMFLQILNQHRDGPEAAPTTGQLSQLGSFPFEGLLGGSHIQI